MPEGHHVIMLFCRARIAERLSVPLVMIIWAASSPSALAAESVFTVAKYPVEAIAEDAVIAKRDAMAEGQLGAFRSLMKRLVPVTAYKNLPRPKLNEIEPLLTGIRVRSEQNSRTEYLATLDFEYNADGVRSYMRSAGLPFLERQAPETLLVPVYRNPNPDAPRYLANRPGGKVWRQAWSGLDLANSLSPVKLASFKPEIRDDVLAAFVSGDMSVLRIFQQEFGASRIVFAHATPGAGKLIVTVVGLDSIGTFHIQRSYRIEDDDLLYTAELATIVGLGILEGRWKAVNRPTFAGSSGQVGVAENVSFFVNFNGLPQWQRIRQRIAEIPGATNLDTGSVSARGAEVSMSYPGGIAVLQQQLASQGMYLTNRDGVWILEAN